MRTSVVASMGTTYTHRDEVRATAAASRPAPPTPHVPSRLVRRVAELLKRP